MKLNRELDIIIAPQTKSGKLVIRAIRKHQCDILISFNHIDGFEVIKNRYDRLPIQQWGETTIKDILSIGSLYPRKKKKKYKNQVKKLMLSM